MKKAAKKGLGTFDFFTIGFGAIVGVGWAVSLNSWMANAGGPLPAAAGYLLALIVVVPIALCYAELTPMLPVTGGSVAFAHKAFGPPRAFLAGWAAIGGFITVLPWEAIYINDILCLLFPALTGGKVLYYVMGSPIYLRAVLVGVVCSLLIFGVNWIGVRSSANFQKLMCLFLLSAGVLAIVAALFKADPANLQPIYENVGRGSHRAFPGGAFAILASAPFFLAGFETIPQGIEDASGNIKSVGKTILASVALACIFYAILLVTLGMAMPWQQFYVLPSPAVSNMMQLIYGGSLGKALWILILAGALCGLFTTWNAFMMATPRLLQGLARASLIPPVFARTHPKYKTPSVALLLCAAAATVGPFLGIKVIDTLTSFSSAALVFCWLMDVCSMMRLRKTEPQLHRPYRAPGGVVMARISAVICAAVFIMFIIPGSVCYIGNVGVLMLGIWAVLGAIFYRLTAARRLSIPEEQRTASLFARMNTAEQPEEE